MPHQRALPRHSERRLVLVALLQQIDGRDSGECRRGGTGDLRKHRRPPPVRGNASEEKGKGGRGSVAGGWRRRRRRNQRALGRRAPSRPLVSAGGGCRAELRTCVLARRWRDLWKSATGLRIGRDLWKSVHELRHFVNHLHLLRRNGSSIHTCELRFSGCTCRDDHLCLNLWIQHVVDRGVRVLRLESQGEELTLDMPLFCQHLTTLQLDGVFLSDSFCNFSNFPNLQHLEISSTSLDYVEISSKSLKHLSLRKFCCFELHTLICTPNLVSLTLDVHFCSIPVLSSMPSLKEAFVRNISIACQKEGCFSCDGRIPDGYSYNENKCFLLQGLSEAENLTLMSDYNGFVFHRDLEWCPTFNKLRVLVLDDWWFVHRDFYGLNCILKHSPVLEKLTLHLFLKATKHKVEIIGGYNQMERSATISKHLKEIEIKCKVVDEKVHKVLKFLGTFGICFLFK